MKIRLLILNLSLLFVTNAFSQKKDDTNAVALHRHDLRISYSDALTLGISNFLGVGLSDALTNTTRSDAKSSGMLTLGYRYSLQRFKVGADLGFVNITSKASFFGEKFPSIKERDLNFIVLPSGEFLYFKKGLVELYGSAGAGVIFSRTSVSGLNPAGKKYATGYKSKLTSDFAYQVNPIAIRVGNDRIAGFFEAGLGYKGFTTIGVSVRF
ncbi:MAG: hypothetical protein RR202_02445 [Bacteroidales bacterium]